MTTPKGEMGAGGWGFGFPHCFNPLSAKHFFTTHSLATKHFFGEIFILPKIKTVSQDGHPVKFWSHKKTPNAVNSYFCECKNSRTMQ